jgi:hypothetical protein
MGRRWGRRKRIALPAGILAVLLLILLAEGFGPLIQGEGARETVRRFYTLEQSGNFGEAWTLFDPQMQAKYPKEVYIQRRAHVFMQDFGVKTFDFTVGRPSRVTSWKMSEDSPAFPGAYRIPVRQHFHSAFGNFTIEQDVFAVREDNQWRILWSYRD